MGQTSLPVLNRTGLSTFWQGVWDDKYNYNRNWKEDDVFKKILPFLIIFKSTRTKYFLDYNTLYSSRYLANHKNVALYGEQEFLLTFLGHWLIIKKRYKQYLLKTWVIKFQTWFVFFFKIYTPMYKQQHTRRFKKKANLLGYYHFHLSSNVSNCNYLKSFKHSKYEF